MANLPRLPEEAYVGQVNVAFVANCRYRRARFRTHEEVHPVLLLLTSAALHHACSIPIYCFMPDHLHVILHGDTDASTPMLAMRKFKTDSANWFMTLRGQALWQTRFFDHLIRDWEDWNSQGLYILNNPVKAGLVEDPRMYPFTGTVGWDIDRLFQSFE